jgi:hypothetical protein
MTQEITYSTVPYKFSDLIGKTLIAITDNPYTIDHVHSIIINPCQFRDDDEPCIYLLGIFECEEDYEYILFVSDDSDCGRPIYTNWRLCKLVIGTTKININEHFKFIREKINDINILFNSENIGNYTKQMIESDNIVCPSGPDQGKYYITINTNLKQIKLGNKHVDCCYQESIWEFI